MIGGGRRFGASDCKIPSINQKHTVTVSGRPDLNIIIIIHRGAHGQVHIIMLWVVVHSPIHPVPALYSSSMQFIIYTL